MVQLQFSWLFHFSCGMLAAAADKHAVLLHSTKYTHGA
jgi:hypothetical protein